jgi:hypothetical protein
MTATIQRRSNRPLTQYACDLLDDFLKGKLDSCEYSNENTAVKCVVSKSPITTIESFDVYLYGAKILEVVASDGKAFFVKVSTGNHFTIEGYPKKTTIERLNGLLDELGSHMILPEGVRIFKDRIENLFYLGKGDNKIAVGKGLATEVILYPDHNEFRVQASDLVLNNAN